MTITELIEKHADEMGYPRARHRAQLGLFAIALLELLKASNPNSQAHITRDGDFGGEAIDKALEELRK